MSTLPFCICRRVDVADFDQLERHVVAGVLEQRGVHLRHDLHLGVVLAADDDLAAGAAVARVAPSRARRRPGAGGEQRAGASTASGGERRPAGAAAAQGDVMGAPPSVSRGSVPRVSGGRRAEHPLSRLLRGFSRAKHRASAAGVRRARATGSSEPPGRAPAGTSSSSAMTAMTRAPLTTWGTSWRTKPERDDPAQARARRPGRRSSRSPRPAPPRAAAPATISGIASGSSTGQQQLAPGHAHAPGRLDGVAVDLAHADVGVGDDRRQREQHQRHAASRARPGRRVRSSRCRSGRGRASRSTANVGTARPDVGDVHREQAALADVPEPQREREPDQRPRPASR